MVFCGSTGGRREKRSSNYLSVKNPTIEKREKRAGREKIERENKEKEVR